MAITADRISVPLSAGERLNGLNHIAELRTSHWGDSWPEVARFIEDLCDKRDAQYDENSRALAAIFFLARVPAARQALGPHALTLEEKRAVISAMNHFRAVVSLFPKRLTLPR
ncbi:hypothetical protein GA0061071_112147 [Kosakonia oryzendophytica]|uniref:DUF5347 domain-containing protein n=1 Tax=Kosakonia oryzendophytica TaxID=1005665 RepID=A0A1C4DJH7_9ENTR|nr:DUF5347 domain-containing protein [Kosakonia oryzendophytica]TDT57206.1 hypothetical protein DFO53_3240 [Enterobacter sp. AG5470]WBT59380.1 DUF5347 domain-containing protein [Kosakonia oryzendophytica]SCC31513.1 hypothetical protein GA0061071_112147 [Kosakonia oryzendophytica]